ncbi:MurR/RpiR family transcriptional regulator [Lichenifustis flavocetrariae]|uniref:MurR/RpiR family transcriptional regulator n=1 Tax=Lichenifustis flavocetrariae TaxID=2949735 RepID=A0AA42CKP8_9HYPH|nr:MurR/RpiR family transcriptional regulator [Lichenifustis flavocetrariae]MCW6510788.1 MurR/RpiR family transcriptional regulator [Lichenifustis flavocetrariae]
MAEASVDPSMTGDPGIGSRAVDIFQKLVSASRSPDRTMARLSQWMIDNQTRAASLSISSVASASQVSETTVFRFCKLLGLTGYRDLRNALAEGRGLALGAQLVHPRLQQGACDEHPLAAVMRRVIEVNSEALLKTMSLVALPALQEAVDALLVADHIHLVGFGSSAPVAFDAYQRLLYLGFTASVHSDPHVLAAVTANARPSNLFLGISCSGRTRDLVETLQAAGARGAKRLAITSDRNSPVATTTDIMLISAVRRSPIAHETIGTRTSQLAIIEMICVALALQHPDREQLDRSIAVHDREIAKKRLPDMPKRARPQRLV